MLNEEMNLVQFSYVVSVNRNCFKKAALEDVITWNSKNEENTMSTLLRNRTETYRVVTMRYPS